MLKSSSVSQNDISSQTHVAINIKGRFNILETKCIDEKKNHQRTVSKETGDIYVANQEESEEESSQKNLSYRENKSEIEGEHNNLSFSDHRDKK